MIKISLSLTGSSACFEIKGHSGYAEEGRDLVCAAVSAVSQTALLGLLKVCGINVNYEVRDGYLKAVLPEGISEDKRQKAEVILLTMREGLKDIADGYPRFVKLEEH